MSEGELDCLFDQYCRQARAVSPIRQEDKVLPPAPRYALDLSAVPAEFLNILPGYADLPHKNQEETREWVERINEAIRAKNAGRRGSRIREWAYDGTPNEPPYACLSYGISTVMDWWSQQCGDGLPTYSSSIHGREERGWDPRTFELEYFYRASTGRGDYALFSRQLPVERDPVRRISVPYSPHGYAEIAVETRDYANPDPYTGQVYRFDAARNPMEGRYVQLFSNRILRSHTPDKYAKALAEAIDRWGIAYVQLEQTERPRMFGAHSVGVIGYFCMEMGGRYLRCADNRTDADWARTAFFVVHDSFGDFPADKVRAADGGSAYRAVRIGSVDEAYVFPHSLRVAAAPEPERPGTWALSVTNRCGRPVPVEGDLRVRGRPGETVSVVVPVKHYFEADGKPRQFSVLLDPISETLGTERVRTPEQRSFYEAGR